MIERNINPMPVNEIHILIKDGDINIHSSLYREILYHITYLKIILLLLVPSMCKMENKKMKQRRGDFFTPLIMTKNPNVGSFYQLLSVAFYAIKSKAHPRMPIF